MVECQWIRLFYHYSELIFFKTVQKNNVYSITGTLKILIAFIYSVTCIKSNL